MFRFGDDEEQCFQKISENWWGLITILQFNNFCGVSKTGWLVPHFQSSRIFRSSFFDAVTRWLEHRKLIMKTTGPWSTSTKSSIFHPPVFYGAEYHMSLWKVSLESIFQSINWYIFQRASPTFTICQLKVIGGIVQYLSVARGTEINFIDLETEFN